MNATRPGATEAGGGPGGDWGTRGVRWLRRHPMVTFVSGCALEASVALTFRALDFPAWVGVPGAFGSLIAVAVALVVGPLPAVAVALFGGSLLVVLVALDAATEPFLGGVPVIVVWVLAALVAGLISERERHRTAEALETLEHARTEAMQAKAQADSAVRRTQRLQAVTAELSRAVSVGQVADVIARQGLAALEASGGAVCLLTEDGSSLELIRSAGYPVDVIEAWDHIDVDAPVPIAEAVREGRAIYVENAQMLERHFPAVAGGPRLAASQAWAAVPLVGSAGALGALALSFDQARWFDVEDRGMMFGLASQSAQALDRARLYEQQRGIAEVLQRSFLPDRLPRIAMLELDAHYAAGGLHTEVGGDWYDVIDLDEGAVGLVIGDVAGRGVHAATVMGQLRNGVRAYAIDRDRPADVLAAVDHLLQRHGPHDVATLLYAILDPATGRFRYACAGHPPPLLRLPDGTVRFLEQGRSVPIGAVPGVTFEEGEDVLPEGSTLVLYTDGLIERRDESLEEGLARLRQAVEDGPASASEVREHLVRVLASGENQEDDVALITLRRVAPDVRFRETLPARRDSLQVLRRRLRAWLAHTLADPEQTFDVLVAVNEASANSIEHAYGGVGGDFDVEAEMEGDRLMVSVRDRGRYRPRREGADGRGMEIMHALMDDVDVRTEDDGTFVQMRRSLGRID